MRTIKRGWRNVYRSPLRATLAILILGLSVAMFLTMFTVSNGVAEQSQLLSREVQTLIEVRAAGATGMGVGADALREEFFEKAKAVPDVASIEPYLLQRLIDESKPASIAIVLGTRPGDAPRVASHGEVGAVQLAKGRYLTQDDAGKNVAVVGKVFADQYGLDVGDEFVISKAQIQLQDRLNADVEVEDLPLKVVGIFKSGFVFGDNQVFVPLSVAQKAFAQEERISHIFVTASSVDRVDQVVKDLRKDFGFDADVISGQNTARAFTRTLGSIRNNSLWSAVAAIAVGALVALFTMVLVVRERTREIGVLKAIGASDGDVARQFAAEAMALALVGGAVGILLFGVAGSVLGSVLLQRMAGNLLAITAMGGGNPVEALTISYGFSAATVAYAILAIVVLGALGSLYPVAQALRMRPADAMREE